MIPIKELEFEFIVESSRFYFTHWNQKVELTCFMERFVFILVHIVIPWHSDS